MYYSAIHSFLIDYEMINIISKRLYIKLILNRFLVEKVGV